MTIRRAQGVPTFETAFGSKLSKMAFGGSAGSPIRRHRAAEDLARPAAPTALKRNDSRLPRSGIWDRPALPVDGSRNWSDSNRGTQDRNRSPAPSLPFQSGSQKDE